MLLIRVRWFVPAEAKIVAAVAGYNELEGI